MSQLLLVHVLTTNAVLVLGSLLSQRITIARRYVSRIIDAAIARRGVLRVIDAAKARRGVLRVIDVAIARRGVSRVIDTAKSRLGVPRVVGAADCTGVRAPERNNTAHVDLRNKLLYFSLAKR